MARGLDAGWCRWLGTAGMLLAGLVPCGCVTLPGQPGGSDTGPRPSPRLLHTDDPAPVPDLRIPVDAVADARDIPLVPLPAVPGMQRDRPGTGGIKRVAAQAPAAPEPASVTPAPLTVPAAAPPAGNPAAPAPLPSMQAPATVTVRQLHEQAAARYARVDSYISRLTRREQVKNKNMPEEILLFKFRKEPWSVHFKWLGEVGKGREVIYVKDHYGNEIHTLLAAGDAPFMPAGKRMDLAVDSILVRSASRHSITEAGIGSSIEHLGRILEATERGDQRRGTLTALPAQVRPEYKQPVDAIEHILPAGYEPELPQGGSRIYFFDPETHLPLLVIARDPRGQEVEYYRYDLLQTPVHLDDDDFNPDKLWAPANKPSSARK